MSNLFIQSFDSGLLDNDIHDVFRFKVVHVFLPHLMELLIRELVVIFDRSALFNVVIVENLLLDLLVFDLFSVLRLTTAPFFSILACLLALLGLFVRLLPALS